MKRAKLKGMKLAKTKENLMQISKLITFAFNKKNNLSKDPNFLSRYQHSEGYGIINDYQLESYIMVNNFNCRNFNKRTKFSGIGYVSSSKAARGKGNISKLMSEILENLHQEKIPIANLAPFSETFYRQYGFEDSIYQKTYTFPASLLQDFKMAQGAKVKTGKWNDLLIQNAVAQLYEVPMHSNNQRLTMNRPFWWWNRLASYYPNREIAVYYSRVGLPEAYMFFERKQDLLEVSEIFSLTGDGYRGLFSYLAQNQDAINNCRIIAADNSHLEDLFSQQRKLTIQIQSYMMSRIIDISEVLAATRFVNDGQFIIEVKNDRLCPWNNGCWKISKEQDDLEISRSDSKPILSGSIEDWTKVLLGNLTVESAIKLGIISKKQENNFEVEKGTISFYDYY